MPLFIIHCYLFYHYYLLLYILFIYFIKDIESASLCVQVYTLVSFDHSLPYVWR